MVWLLRRALRLKTELVTLGGMNKRENKHHICTELFLTNFKIFDLGKKMEIASFMITKEMLIL